MTPAAAARRYAHAVFDVVRAEGDVDAVQRDLQQFADVIQQHDVLATVLANPAIPAPRKRAVIEAILKLAGPIATPLKKLVLLLAERDRLALLPPIATAYRERLLDFKKIIRGDVITAVPLADEKLRALEQSLGRATGRQVVLEPRVDPSIIGGVVTRLGSTVYDGSVTTQLQKMKQALVESGQ